MTGRPLHLLSLNSTLEHKKEPVCKSRTCASFASPNSPRNLPLPEKNVNESAGSSFLQYDNFFWFILVFVR